VIGTPSPFSPTIIKRVSRMLPTSACTVVVETDCGTGYMKAIGNNEGPWILACELIATRLAQWFGLSTFEYAIVNVHDYHGIHFHNGKKAIPGPAFITRAEYGEQWDGSEKQLKLLDNPEDLSRLVVFDTWTLNCDRYSIQGTGVEAKPRRNQGNVFLSEETQPGKLELKAMDHTHCFSCGRSLSPKQFGIDKIRDPRVFGLFPEFRTFLAPEVVKLAVDQLRTVSKGILDQATNDIPHQWGVSRDSIETLTKLLLSRASFVGDTIEKKIWPQLDLGLESTGDES
jgi:hypothetical protein